MAVSLSASAGPGGGGRECVRGRRLAQFGEHLLMACRGGHDQQQLAAGGAEPESVWEAWRRQPEPAGRDLGLLVAEHEEHQPLATQKPSCSRAIA
jgi:hypothetical protein